MNILYIVPDSRDGFWTGGIYSHYLGSDSFKGDDGKMFCVLRGSHPCRVKVFRVAYLES